MRKNKPTGLSLPISFLEQIDGVRGDVPRSKYILKLLQRNAAAATTTTLQPKKGEEGE